MNSYSIKLKILLKCIPSFLLILNFSEIVYADKLLTFTNISSTAGIVSGIRGAHGIIIADINGDNYDDIYITNCGDSATPDLLYINQNAQGHNSFVQDAYSRGVYDLNSNGCSHGAIWGDFDKDGDYDLINGNTGERNRYYQNNGNGYFTDVTLSYGLQNYPGETRGVLTTYMNSDYRLDLFNVNYGYTSLQYNEYYLNTGRGYFSFVGQYISPGVVNHLYNLDYELEQGITSADIDNDGDIDIFICRRGNPDQLYINDGTGYYTDEAPIRGVNFSSYGDGAVFGDIDTDGDLDLILAGTGNSILKIMKNDGAGFFLDVSGSSNIVGYSYMANLGDLDLDGDLDLVVSRYKFDQGTPANGRNNYYLNNGNGVFTEAGTFFSNVWDNKDARSVALFDMDNDGDLDVIFALQDGTAKLFRNNININRWIKIKLFYRNTIGAFGTKISINTPLKKSKRLRAYREATSARGYLVQNSPVVHAGLPLNGNYDISLKFADGMEWNFVNIHTGNTLDLTGMFPILETPIGAAPEYSVEEQKVHLSWEQNDSASIRDYFEVWRMNDNEGLWSKISTTTNLTYDDYTVQEATPYAYKVRSIDVYKRISDYSNLMSITIPSTPDLSTIGLIVLLSLIGLILISKRKLSR